MQNVRPDKEELLYRHLFVVWGENVRVRKQSQEPTGDRQTVNWNKSSKGTEDFYENEI